MIERCVRDALNTALSMRLLRPNLAPADVLQHRLSSCLSDTRRELADAGVIGVEQDDVVFAISALLDETVLATSDELRRAWGPHLLQLQEFGRNNAGYEFFERLDRVMAASSDRGPHRIGVLQVYYQCLCLGFQGRYRIQERIVLEQLLRDLRGLLRSAGVIADEPFVRTKKKVAKPKRARGRVTALALVALAASTLLYLGLRWDVSRLADVTRREIGSPVSEPTPASGPEEARLIQEADKWIGGEQ